MSREKATAGPTIGEIGQRHDSLLVLDVDEVVLHFIEPFEGILAEHGARLSVDSFRLTGNVRSLSTGEALTGHELDGITAKLYAEQEARQQPVSGVAQALQRLAGITDIVFLTAMTPAYFAQRRRLLDREGLAFPMIATERSKGAVVAELCERWRGRVVFVDDLPPNLVSVSRSAPAVLLVHLMANDVFRAHLPSLPASAHAARDWNEAETLLTSLLQEEGKIESGCSGNARRA